MQLTVVGDGSLRHRSARTKRRRRHRTGWRGYRSLGADRQPTNIVVEGICDMGSPTSGFARNVTSIRLADGAWTFLSRCDAGAEWDWIDFSADASIGHRRRTHREMR